MLPLDSFTRLALGVVAMAGEQLVLWLLAALMSWIAALCTVMAYMGREYYLRTERRLGQLHDLAGDLGEVMLALDLTRQQLHLRAFEWTRRRRKTGGDGDGGS